MARASPAFARALSGLWRVGLLPAASTIGSRIPRPWILNPDNGLANVLANFSDAKADGRESISGTEAVRVTGNVSADAVNKIAPQLKAEGPVPGTAWITEDGNHTLLQAKLEPTPGNSVTMTLTDWGKQVTVTKPAS